VSAFGTGEAYFAGYGNFGQFDQTYHLGTLSTHELFFSQWGGAVFGPTLQASQWYHIGVTNVGNSITLYVNGSARATGSLTINNPVRRSFYIGRVAGDLGNTRKLTGEVDEVSVYNRALSDSEMLSIYQAGTDGKIKPGSAAGAAAPSAAA